MRSIVHAALGLLLLLGACHKGEGSRPAPDVVAQVNGDSITASALTRELRQARRDDENLAPRTAADQKAFRQTVLDDLIQRTLLLQAARAAHVAVPQDQIDRALLQLRAEYPGQAFDQALAEDAQTIEELRAETRARLTIERYFAGQVFSRLAVTDPEIEAYYQAHQRAFAHPEEVHALQIVVEDQDTARRVLAELKQGERFEELARRYSRSADAKVGGDLGFFPRGQMPEIFDQVCFSLPAGKISDVVASPYGFHLFKVLERRPAGVAPLSEIRGKVEAKLRAEREEAAQKQTVAELRAKAHIQIEENVLARVQ